MHSYSLLETCKECGLSLLMANREVMIGPLWFGNVLFIALMIEVILCAVIKKLKIPHAREVRLERVHIKRASKIIANMMTDRKMESSLS